MDVKLVIEILTALRLAVETAKAALALMREVIAAIGEHKHQNNG